MALTFRNWLAVAVVSCVVAGAVASRPRQRAERPRDPRRELDRAQSVAGQAAARAANRLRVLELRDSVKRALRALPASDSSRWLVDRRLPAAMANPLQALQARARQFRPSTVTSPVDVAIVLDSSSTVRGVSRGWSEMVVVDYLLPTDANDRCTVLVSIRPPAVRPTLHQRGEFRQLSTDFTAHRLMGPCGFYEWFGAPGPQVDAWLRSGGWAFGFHPGAWERAAQPWAAYSRWWWYSGFGSRQAGWPLRDFVSGAGYRCITGDASTCERLLFVPSERTERTNLVWNSSIVGSGPYLRFLFEGRGRFELGAKETELLAALVHRFGEQRFRQFWTSTAAPAAAFTAAMGQPAGETVVAWADRVYGEHHRGPGVEGAAAAGSVLFGLLALGLAVRGARRRRAG